MFGLSKPHATLGVVVHGDRRGRTIGFPTANLPLPDDSPIPDGVYAGWVEHAEQPPHPAVVSVGRRATIYGDTGIRLLEAHLLGFDDDLYDAAILVHLTHWIRGQERFDSLEHLVAQLHRDRHQAEQALDLDVAARDPVVGGR